jgi:hypothetical protein
MSCSRAVYCVNWVESERGWGQRPDGYSLHISGEVAKEYSDDYMERQRGALGNDVPDEYSYPGSLRLVRVNEEIYNEVKNRGSVRYWGHEKVYED